MSINNNRKFPVYFFAKDATLHILDGQAVSSVNCDEPRNCFYRAIARYSVVKELYRAVVAAGPLCQGRSKILKGLKSVNVYFELFLPLKSLLDSDLNPPPAAVVRPALRSVIGQRGRKLYPGWSPVKKKKPIFCFFSKHPFNGRQKGLNCCSLVAGKPHEHVWARTQVRHACVQVAGWALLEGLFVFSFWHSPCLIP